MKFFFAYIVVASYAMSLVLIQVDNGVQRPVYYVSKSLHEVEVRYLPLEKAILAVVLGTRKLPHYCGGQYLSLCTGLKVSFFNNNASEEKKAWGKAP